MKRLLLAPLLLACSSLAFADKAADVNVSPAERAKIEEVVHQYLIQKPEVLVEALQVLQAKQSQQAERTVKETQKIAAAYADPLFHQENDPIGGNPNGKITIVEFFDYQCPHCVDMAPIIDSIVKANPDVRVVYKEFPVRGPLSKLAASAALAANQQGKYNAFSHALLNAREPLSEDAIFQLAKAAGLDIAKLKQAMSSALINNQIEANIKLAQDLKLLGTPAFFIGKTSSGSTGISYTPGHMNQQQLQEAIDRASK